MPTYEYQCRSCKHELEIFQSMTEAPKRKCPECGKQALVRKIGLGAAILFKGSGFYQTDYRSASYRKAAQADKPAENKPAENKPADNKPADGNNGTSSSAAAPSEAKPSSASKSKPTEH